MEAQRCVQLTGTNEPCGLTIFFFFAIASTWKRELPFAGYSVVTACSLKEKGTPLRRSGKIVRDDPQGDEARLLAAFHPVGPRTTMIHLRFAISPFVMAHHKSAIVNRK